VAGDDFSPSADVLRIQAGALLVTFVGAPLGYALLSLRKHAVLLTVTSAALVLNVILVPLLADAHGAQGAAAATLAAELALTGGALIFLARIDPALRPRLRAALRAAPGFAAGSALLLIPDLPAAAAMVLATALYVGLALLLRAVPEEFLAEARAARRGLRRRSG
jgi:O-antigen/teichoic acid export membrane protein